MPFVPGEKETSTNDPRYGFFQGGIPETPDTPPYPSGSPLCKSVFPYLIYSSSQTDLQTAAGRPGNYPAMRTNRFKSIRKRFEICTLQSAKRHKLKFFRFVPFFLKFTPIGQIIITIQHCIYTFRIVRLCSYQLSFQFVDFLFAVSFHQFEIHRIYQLFKYFSPGRIQSIIQSLNLAQSNITFVFITRGLVAIYRIKKNCTSTPW